VLLTRKGTEALVRVERLLDDASRALATKAPPSKTLGALDGPQGRANAVAAATDQRSGGGPPRGD
jgi:hypothetical protein